MMHPESSGYRLAGNSRTSSPMRTPSVFGASASPSSRPSLLGSHHGSATAHWDHEPIVTNSCYTCNMNMSTYRRRFMERGRILAGRPANQAALALRQTRDFSSVV